MAEFTISEVPDPLATWDELEPLYRGLHEHHEPLRNFKLVDGWQAGQRASLTAEGDIVVFLARSADAPIGVLDGSIRVHPITEVCTGYINSAYVLPEWRRQRVTHELVDHFSRWATARGATELGLNVDSANESAVEAWRALGFEAISLRMARELPW